MKKIMILCFILAVLIRVYSVFPYNTVFGFDQARDFFDSYTMIQNHHLRVIGPTAGNDLNLHHGIAFIYYLSLPILFLGPSPMNAVYFNILVQSSLVFILSFFSWELFKSKQAVILTALLTAFSYNLTQFAGWLSNPTVTLVTVPIFYLSLWKYRQNEKWLIFAALALGCSIEFELFFIYLIPVFLIYWILFRPKLPSLKIAFLSISAFLISTSSMIATEIKYSFSGVKDILLAGNNVGGNLPFLSRIQLFLSRLGDQLSLSIGPVIPALVVITICAILYIKTSKRSSLRFLYLYAASPALMLFLGAHNAPWFLIGLPPAIIILYSYFFSRLKLLGFGFVAILIIISFIKISESGQSGQELLGPDKSAILSRQVAAMDYTYEVSKGKDFSIDSVSNPLYINAVWGYDYLWYGKAKYGYLPHWLGGDQLPPYDVFPKASGSEETSFILSDDTPRIAEIYRIKAIEHLEEKNVLVNKKSFDEISVYQFEKR